jgi:hypothetical protein
MNFAQMLIAFLGFSKPWSSNSQLEEYIIINKPQNNCDVEKLMREFESKRTLS